MPEYRLTAEASADLIAGVTFYNSSYPDLGQDFALEVRRLCRLITKSPAAGFEVRPDVRRRILRRFPFSVLYTLNGDDVLVIANAHQRRRPGYWNRRT